MHRGLLLLLVLVAVTLLSLFALNRPTGDVFTAGENVSGDSIAKELAELRLLLANRKEKESSVDLVDLQKQLSLLREEIKSDQKEDADLTSLVKTELQEIRKEIFDDEANGESTGPAVQYLGMIPGFGPNNQYMGLKELIWWAQLSGRTLVQPDFFIHDSITLRVTSIRPYHLTFDAESTDPIIESTTMAKFAAACNHTVDALVWLRTKTDGWMRWVNFYAEYETLTIKNIIEQKEFGEHVSVSNKETAKKFLKAAEGHKCVLFAFPFRNVHFEKGEYAGISKYLEHASHVRESATAVIDQLGSSKEKLMAWHWRWGEITCRSEPIEYHEGYDFCWGTQIFYWATIENILIGIREIIAQHKITHIYMSTDAPPGGCDSAYEKIKATLEKEGIVVRQKLETHYFNDMFDNYYISLIEQEICAMAKVFIATADSTWSDYVRDYLEATENKHTTVHTLDQVLNMKKLPYTRRNCYNDAHHTAHNGAVIKNPDTTVKPTKYFCE